MIDLNWLHLDARRPHRPLLALSRLLPRFGLRSALVWSTEPELSDTISIAAIRTSRFVADQAMVYQYA